MRWRRRRRWGGLVAPFADCALAAEQSIAYLHLPKTGGTSLRSALMASPDWTVVTPQRHAAGPPPIPPIPPIPPNSGTGPGFCLGLEHEPYDALEWWRARLGRHGVTIGRTLTTVRPARERVVSMFHFYWTLVHEAEAATRGELQLPPDVARVADYHRHDARHYRSDDGTIDGRKWFGAFDLLTHDVTFFLDDVFGGSPERLRRAVGSDGLELVRAEEVDALQRSLTGGVGPRLRTRTRLDPERLETAARTAADLIDRLAARDADYDRVIADLTGDDAFRA